MSFARNCSFLNAIFYIELKFNKVIQKKILYSQKTLSDRVKYCYIFLNDPTNAQK